MLLVCLENAHMARKKKERFARLAVQALLCIWLWLASLHKLSLDKFCFATRSMKNAYNPYLDKTYLDSLI